jgi:REP element-mobilizing transposase RayT
MSNYNPNLHKRQSTRLKGYDYSKEGNYFLTICCQDKECLFGDVVNGKMILNNIGEVVNECWLKIPNHFPKVKLKEYVIMPNHIHGIIELINDEKSVSNNTAVENLRVINLKAENEQLLNSIPIKNSIIQNNFQKCTPRSIGSIIKGFKIGVTKWIRDKNNFEPILIESVWQRNYHEHIIRDNREYGKIVKYIINNPSKWEIDKLHVKK